MHTDILRTFIVCQSRYLLSYIHKYIHTYIHTYIRTASENTEFFSRGTDYTKQGEEILEAAFSLSQLLNGLKTAGVVTYAGTVTGTAYSAFANMPVTYTDIHTYINIYILYIYRQCIT